MSKDQVAIFLKEYIKKNLDLLGISEDIEIENQTILFGKDGILDSLRLVHLVVGVEHEFKKIGFTKLELTSPKAMSHSSSPFRSIDALSSFISTAISK